MQDVAFSSQFKCIYILGLSKDYPLTSASNICLGPITDRNTRRMPQRRTSADTMSYHLRNNTQHPATIES
jgi:hypothetical protein